MVIVALLTKKGDVTLKWAEIAVQCAADSLAVRFPLEILLVLPGDTLLGQNTYCQKCGHAFPFKWKEKCWSCACFLWSLSPSCRRTNFDVLCIIVLTKIYCRDLGCAFNFSMAISALSQSWYPLISLAFVKHISIHLSCVCRTYFRFVVVFCCQSIDYNDDIITVGYCELSQTSLRRPIWNLSKTSQTLAGLLTRLTQFHTLTLPFVWMYRVHLCNVSSTSRLWRIFFSKPCVCVSKYFGKL